MVSLTGGLILMALGQAAAGHVLFEDPLDGAAASKQWRVAPAVFATAPDGKRAARFARGRTWSADGQPWAGDASWDAYRLEVEIWPEEMWAGVDFHVQDDGRSGIELTLFQVTEDRLALELSGLWGQASAWKLWPVGQTAPVHRTGWVRLRVDVSPELANVYVGDSQEIAATFRDLPFARGGVRLAAYAGSALFRNLRVTRLAPGLVQPALEDPWSTSRSVGVLRDWRVSQRFAPGAAPTEPPAADATWRTPVVDGRGVVHLTALVPEANDSGVFFARTVLRAEAAGEQRLRLTYTDGFSMWCNGRMVFEGPPRQWFHPDRAKNGHSRLIPDQYEVVVPLRQGDNELAVRSETSEPFGWGFWVRLRP